jgi:uncharacterized LabA/DUF88 family protein
LAACLLFLSHIPPEPSGEGREAAGAILWPLLFMALKTNVYVDGFNLYYGCVKDTVHRWLDLAALCKRLVPNNTINRIRYFTALVTPRPSDPQQRMRQEIYLRALRTIPNLTLYTGRFLASKVWMRRADGLGYVQVLKSEEKGSDVNLANSLLIDCYLSDCDIAVIISNDSDLVFPIEHVKRHLGKIIGVVNPHKRPSHELFAIANFYKSIRPGALAASHFPDKLTDALGDFHKPPTW